MRMMQMVVYSERFNSEEDTYFDVRFFAEGRVKAWIDDVLVREVPPPAPRPAGS